MIPPIGSVSAGASQAVRQASTATPAAGAADAGADFAGMVRDGLTSVSNAEHAANAAIEDIATGGDTRIEDVMVATTQAQLGLELLSRVRDRALDAYTEIMRMPL